MEDGMEQRAKQFDFGTDIGRCPSAPFPDFYDDCAFSETALPALIGNHLLLSSPA